LNTTGFAVDTALPAGTVGADARYWRSGDRIASATVALLIFLGGFVIVEPAPYDLVLVAAIVGWALFGLRLNRHFLPLTVLLLTYTAGGFLGLTQITEPGKPLMYVLVTLYLAASSVFFAAIIAADPERRMKLIERAYIFSAIVVAAIGILAYFNAIPGADAFKLYNRAKGTFQDPNVFGPFLVLPLALLFRDILTNRLRRSIWNSIWFLVILFAIFLSFSRAAWGMAVGTVLLVAFMTFVTTASTRARMRLVAWLVTGSAAVTIMLAAAISVPAVRSLYVDRAQVVQSYDESQTGRFERQAKGFFLIQEKPLGIGPSQFAHMFGEEEHNMWLKGFTVYGWLGGFSYIILAVWTVAASFPLLFKPRPWLPVVQCTWAVLVGHLLIHNVIDNDHWRHLFLLYGILWGAIAAEKMRRRRRAGVRHAAAMRTGPVTVVHVAGLARA
jgi:hypothetical protein